MRPSLPVVRLTERVFEIARENLKVRFQQERPLVQHDVPFFVKRRAADFFFTARDVRNPPQAEIFHPELLKHPDDSFVYRIHVLAEMKRRVCFPGCGNHENTAAEHHAPPAPEPPKNGNPVFRAPAGIHILLGGAGPPQHNDCSFVLVHREGVAAGFADSVENEIVDVHGKNVRENKSLGQQKLRTSRSPASGVRMLFLVRIRNVRDGMCDIVEKIHNDNKILDSMEVL